MAIQAALTVDTTGIIVGGAGLMTDDETLKQDAARVAALAPYTVLSKEASSGKLVPLTDVDPAVVPGSLACGAIGGTAAEFAALASSSFKIGFDGESVIEVVCDFSGLDSPADTAGYMTCGALGGSIPDFAAVSDGQFGIQVDGNAAIQVGSLDFSGLDGEDDLAGYFTCGAAGTNAAGFAAVADGSLRVTVNGVNHDLSGLDFNTVAITGLQQVADVINYAAQGRFYCEYDLATTIFRFVSNTTGETSTVALGATGAGTDLSAAGYLNAAGGAATAGVGGEGTLQTIPGIINAAAAGRFFCFQSGDEMVFVSPTRGETSAVTVLTAGTAGTDISGASYLNGLTGTGTPTAGTGGEGLFESIVDIINAELAGRGTCSFDGDKFIFWSNSTDIGSAVSYLTAGATGTDISGASYLNGLTGTGVITAATTADGENIPIGLYWGDSVTAASLVAGDVTNRKVLVGGDPIILDEDKIILENSLTLASVVTSTGKTIEQHLRDIGIFARETYVNGQIAPV